MGATAGRPAGGPGRLSRELIIDAAVRIAARGASDGLTAAQLGTELGVDRSAVWRHFANKDALLMAVADRLLAMAVGQVPDALAPRARLETLARSVVQVFEAHPYVGAQVACRTTCGEGAFAAAEMMLTALGELGLAPDETARQCRMLADTVLAYAGMRAQYAVLPPDVRAADEHAWVAEYGAADPGQYPAIARYAARLAAVSDDCVLDTILKAFWLAVDALTRADDVSRAATTTDAAASSQASS